MDVTTFRKSIQSMDSMLDVRWGNHMQNWVVERKGVISDTEMGYLVRRVARLRSMISAGRTHHERLYKNLAEELESAHRGARVIIIVKTLDSRVFDLIGLSDIQRYGGFSRLADDLEAAEARAAADKERVEANSRYAFNKEVADMMHFIWRKKEDALLNGHRNMNYLLHGTYSNKPVLLPDTDKTKAQLSAPKPLVIA